MPTTRIEIESLIYLLEDPDPEVQETVQNRFRELGENAVPLLDQFRVETRDQSEKQVINNIIHQLTFGALHEDFSDLLDAGVDDRRQLEKAVFLLARFGNPTLRTTEYERRLNRFADTIAPEIFPEPEDKQMHMLLHYVFRELGFRGDGRDYHNPDNAFIDRVIDRRKGLPVMLGMVVMFLARRLDLPFYGVNMPIHFMLVFEARDGDVLIDPFDGGTIVSYDQCHYFLRKNGITPRPGHLERSGEQEILVRTVRNLIHGYTRSGDDSRVQDLHSLLQLIELKGRH